ncbi:ComF family protein [Bacillus sp. V3B]|uniref:ComF family protein n=1 Tax=Bacillus sp. V3B TaxID=2804915 RepID=UPI00210E963E
MGWNNLISEEKKRTLCPTCKDKLQEIEGVTCRICDRPFDRLDDRFIRGDTCYDCVRWEDDPKWAGCLEKNQSLFFYNDFLQEVIAQFKFRGDYILAKVFSESLLEKLTGRQVDLIVPIPLSPERLQERGFNQAEALINEAGLQPTNLLKRTHSEKQSKKSRKERIHVQQVFQLEPTTLEEKRILLIDDIYTTGSTLRHAAKVLVNHGATTVTSITIARG